MGEFLLEQPEEIDGLLVDPTADGTTPTNGFFKGDPITKISYKEGNVPTAVTDKVHGILQNDLVFPFTNKVLSVARKGNCEVTAAGVVGINKLVGLDSTNKRRFVELTLSTSGITYREAFLSKSAAAAAGDKFIIDMSKPQMVTI